MLIGYISDENHSALCGAVVEFRQGDRSWTLTSSPPVLSTEICPRGITRPSPACADSAPSEHE
ncbi:MAG: hypothetical protein Ct9H300mP1_17540 [Planctomycetaceae bacterium]|nr:MAG: hypothetical protein Ct9H300mP1_17540 [Planctomycetaceae bacterium]